MPERLSGPATETQCPHGVNLGHAHLRGAWAGPVGRCRCCLGRFGYSDSGSQSADGSSESTTNDPTLCRTCGGSARKVSVSKDGKLTIHQEGSALAGRASAAR